MLDAFDLSYNTLVVLAGTSLLGASAGLVGSYAVLRRRALVGDALAHAALPGLCLSVLVFQERSLPLMLLGALVSGVAGLGVVSFLRAYTRIKEDAAIGIVLSVFFGAGYVLSQLIQSHVPSGSRAGLDSYILGKTAGMLLQDVLLVGGVSAICLAIVLALYKEFKVVSFDPAFARVQGWPSARLDLLMMGLVAVTVVIGLPAVGVVLMSALLIIPAVAARFWTDRLGSLLVLSSLFGLLIGGVGTLLSAQYSWSPAGPVIVLTGSVLFVVSMLFAPRRGVIARSVRQRRFRAQIHQQNVLRLVYELTVQDPYNERAAALECVTVTDLLRHTSEPAVELRKLLQRLVEHGAIVALSGDNFRLTDEGRRYAARLERGYRLWELFLTEYADLAGSYVDLDAEHIDEALPRELVVELELKLRQLGRWPRYYEPREAQ